MKRIIPSTLLVLFCIVGPRATAAPYTNFLDATSNALASAYASPSNPVRVHRTLGLALADLRKRSSSVAGDLSMLAAVQAHVGPLGTTGDGLQLVSETLSNALTNFVLEAEAEIAALWDRLELVTPFQSLRRSASNQLVQAQNALASAFVATKFRSAITSTRLAYVKIGVATKLTKQAEANPGPAPEKLMGLILRHAQRGGRGVVAFPTADQFAERNSDGSTDAGPYEYARTGFATAVFIMRHGEDSITTVTLRFITARRGTFVFRNVDSGGTDTGSGTFTLDPAPQTGVAPAALTGLSLQHSSADDSSTNSGVTVFTSATEFTETNTGGSSNGTYEYTVTGPNTASLVLFSADGSTTTVSILFSSATAGYYAAVIVESGGGTEIEGGTFLLGP